MTTPQPHPSPPTDALDALSWSALLARWTEFARASVAFPRTEQGNRWRDAVAPAIALQAIAFALSDLGRLPAGDRPIALDRAEAASRAHAAALHALWAGEPLPEALAEIVADASLALRLAQSAGEELRVQGDALTTQNPTDLADAMLESGFTGDLWTAQPGAILAAGAPAAFARPGFGGARWRGCAEPVWSPQRQIYRQVDPATGLALRDLIAPIEAGLPAGRPVLIPVIEQGRMIYQPDAHANRAWLDAQRRSGTTDQPPPLVDGGGGAGGSA